MSSSGEQPSVGMPDRPKWAVILAWAIFGFSCAGVLVSLWLDRLNGHRSALEGGLADGVFFLAFPIVGVVLATKRPRNPLGWLMLAIGLTFAMPGAPYARYATIARGGELPGAGLALAVSSPSWVPFIGLSGFMLLLFPDGHLPSPRWRWFARACGVGLVLLYLLILFSPGQGVDYDLPQVENPLALSALREGGDWGALLALVAFAPITVVGGAVAIIRRLRRTTDPVQRQQLRWLAWAAGVIAIGYVAAFLPQILGLPAGSSWENVIGSVAVSLFSLIPVTIGIAVLRYRLYDIDFVIRKTVVFAIVAAFIAIVYVAVVVGVGALVGSKSSPALSALAAAIVALVFQPVRARARRFADRLVYGKRATPYEVMARFGGQLAGTYPADDVLARTARVLAEGVGADRARVWLSVEGELTEVAAWPPDHDAERADDLSAEVRHQGVVLGGLSVLMPASDPMDPAKEKLVRDLAAQAGLVLQNEGLTAALKSRLAQLQAAQKRLVAAQDEERRKLERNIHDGAQQQLVALQVRQRLALQLVDRDPAKAKEMLEQLQSDTGEALEDLRDLARGIYPPLLADEGLAAALGSQARKATVPVRIEAAGVGRFPQDIEAAVYFSCLEALQNAAKYADAGLVTVAVSVAASTLTFSVADDGSGFDAAVVPSGSGLQGMADRLGALGGELEVSSVPGGGTTINGRVPIVVGSGLAIPSDPAPTLEGAR